MLVAFIGRINADSLITLGGKSEIWHCFFVDNSRMQAYVCFTCEKNKQTQAKKVLNCFHLSLADSGMHASLLR